MPSNNGKYTQENREKTARYILENKKSATSVAEEMGIDTNTVCRWERDYRRKYNLACLWYAVAECAWRCFSCHHSKKW